MKANTYRTCIDVALEKLEWLSDELPQNPPLKNSIDSMELDLRFFKMFFWGLEHWEETKKNLHLGSARNELKKAVEEFTVHFTATGHGGKITNWDLMSSQLVKTIEMFKPHARKSCTVFLSGLFKCESYHNVKSSIYASEVDDFIGFILENLELLSLKLDQISSLKQQFGFIEEKLKLFRSFVDLVSLRKTEEERLDKLLLHTRTWANHISCLTCLYWVDEMEESLASTMGAMISDSMQKTMPYTPDVTNLYLHALTATRYLNCETEEIHQLVQLCPRYVDFLFENLDGVNDDIEILREGLVFLLSFVTDSPKEDSGDRNFIWTQIDAILGEVPSIIYSVHHDGVEEGISMSKAKFSDFIQKIDRVKAEVSKLYVLIPLSLPSNSPGINAIGFLDFLLGNLKKMLEMKVNFIANVKHHIQTVQEELSSLKPCLQNIMEMQNEHMKIKELWTRIIDVVYYGEYAVNLSSVTDVSLWHRIICLFNVIQETKLIKIEVTNIKYDQTNNNQMLAAEMGSSDALPPQAMTSKKEVFIGFKKDANSIMDHLLGGRKDLTIISISGMPGQGKTTLAKRISSDPSIQYHFHKIVWSNVSKQCKARELLVEIVVDVCKGEVHDVDDVHDMGDLSYDEDGESIFRLEINDLVERLRKKLKGKRYFIVMDDIWDIDVWHKVERSFPNDRNGSRIMFTSRNHNLGSQAKPNSISHPLQLFSDEQSWHLIKEKVFSCDICPPEFSEIGKCIATYCKGLPLAVSLIASVLERTERKLDLWKKVAENLKSHLASEGCGRIIELSYKYLPDHLKSCFLYFGAFPRGKYIRAKKLKLLWLAEGFIKKTEKQCLEDLAEEYLDNLVSLNLVVVTKRSSIGGIKTCNVHDLLYDMCLEKVVEKNFLQLADESVLSQCSSSLQKYNHYRLCIGERDALLKPRPICTRKELPTGQVHSLLVSCGDSQTWGKFSFLDSFRVLTVLDLEGIYVGDDFPEAILSVFHLRYLAIWASIKNIPPSIGELWNLETFIVREGRCAKLPETMLKIESLKHVKIAFSGVRYADSYELELEETSLVYNIETLGSPLLYDHSDFEKLWRRLPKLRKLSCRFPSFLHTRGSCLQAEFRHLKELENLKLCSNGTFIDTPSTLNINFPENLKKLSLSGFELPWSAMATVGKMPNLEVLKLEKNACRGTTWELEDGGEFPKLRFLKLRKLEIQELKVCSGCEIDPFPCLKELVVRSCRNLIEIPSSFGDICTLKTIKLLQSPLAKRSVRRILGKQRDMGNESLQVVIRPR